jgi:uncharacterized protein
MNSVAVSGFDWDDGNRDKCRRHGLSLEEIEVLFRSEPLVAPDIGHSARETRFLAIGRIDQGRAVFVAARDRRRNPHPAHQRPADAQEGD